jgi:hypothetical protein
LEQRLEYFDKLSPFEKELVTNPFPINIKFKNNFIQGLDESKKINGMRDDGGALMEI